MSKFVYSFNEDPQNTKRSLGDKGASLAEMTKIGLPVPFGFTVIAGAAEACLKGKSQPEPELTAEILDKLEELEQVTGKQFGNCENPLLLSVRPETKTPLTRGRQTILNLGLNEETVETFSAETGQICFAKDCYRRLIEDYGYVVSGVEKSAFEEIMEACKKTAGVSREADLTPADWDGVIKKYKILVERETGRPFLEDSKAQLLSAIQTFFRQYAAERSGCGADGTTDGPEPGMAVHVQAMVFGNYGEDSCTGMVFTRNPYSGGPGLCGGFLVRAQGEDLLTGARPLQRIAEMESGFPDAYAGLQRIAQVLEKHGRDMQHIAFTVEKGKLYILRSAPAPRTSLAAIKAAVDMVSEGLITREMAVSRIDPGQIDELLRPGQGTLKEAAAKVMREELRRAIQYDDEWDLPVSAEQMDFSGDLATIVGWADEIRTLKVRTNADNVQEAAQAVNFGAEGIGLCRTEHMFSEDMRMFWMQQSILAETEEQKRSSLEELLRLQKTDFKALYNIMEDRPVTIRLLDPSLYEFLPKDDVAIRMLSERSGIPCDTLRMRKAALEENNPMLGRRGCRMAVIYPELAVMQTRAILEAAMEVSRDKGLEIMPEILIPLVSMEREMAFVKKVIMETVNQCRASYGMDMPISLGTMIEVPRAALIADKIASETDFFSFGTNDLTQMVYGVSRNDTEKMWEFYRLRGLMDQDPFRTIDQDGVGQLIRTAVKLGRSARPNLKLGLCGEHGGDPASIAFCHDLGLNYVSCTPFRVPSAKIAAAQAAIAEKGRG